MIYNENLSEGLAKLARIAPASTATGTVNLGPVSMANMRRLYAMVNIGSVGGGGTVVCQWAASATSGGSYTTFGTASGTLSATGLLEMELKAETLGSNSIGPFVELQITIAVNAVFISAELYGETGYYPGSDYNLVTPTTVVN